MTVKIIDTGSTLTIQNFYNSKFFSGAKTAGATFDDGANFDALSYKKGRQLAHKFFGWDGLIFDTVAIKLTAKKDIVGSRSAIEFFGHVLARAYDRDGGAKIPPNVMFLNGSKPGSGGSRINWCTEIGEGAEIVIKNFPRETFEAVLKKGHDKYELALYDAESDNEEIDLTEE